MDSEIKREALKQYFKSFLVWYIIAGIMLTVFLVCLFAKIRNKPSYTAENTSAPAERVYDFADVLTDEEEEALREYIAEKEQLSKIHLVLVTIEMDMEGTGQSWENAMMNFADDFYDDNNYGYDKIHGDGVLLLDNWYEGQAGSWLVTTGKVERAFGTYEIDQVLDAVGRVVESNPYEGYRNYVREVCSRLGGEFNLTISMMAVGVFSFFMASLIAVIYLVINLVFSKTRDATNAYTYIKSRRPDMINQRDDFIRKNVTHVRIQSSSSGSSGHHSSSGGGGHHHSRSGVSHGGGGRRR